MRCHWFKKPFTRECISDFFQLSNISAHNLHMGNLKKKRRLKMNNHKRRKRLKSNRHKKRTW